MANTAYEATLSQDRDRWAAKQTADLVCNLLRDFIPAACYRDAWEAVAEAAHREGMELTTKIMRKEYEAWKSTQIDMLMSEQAAGAVRQAKASGAS